MSSRWRHASRVEPVGGCTVSEIKRALRDQIADEFLDGDATRLSDDTELIAEEIIDSLGIFLLLGFINDRFGVEVDPEDVTLEHFATINAISGLVEASRSAA